MVNWYRSVNNAFVYKITRLQKVAADLAARLFLRYDFLPGSLKAA